jgi:hypothetical protein
MRRANAVSVVVGVVLAVAGLGSLVGVRRVDVEAARSMETRREELRRMLEGEVPLPGAAGVGVGQPLRADPSAAEPQRSGT